MVALEKSMELDRSHAGFNWFFRGETEQLLGVNKKKM